MKSLVIVNVAVVLLICFEIVNIGSILGDLSSLNLIKIKKNYQIFWKSFSTYLVRNHNT